MKTSKLIAAATASVAFTGLVIWLGVDRYELRLEREANRNWQDLADFQSHNHAAMVSRDQAEIARLQQAQSNSVAAH